MTEFDIILMAVVQGITEFLPISSSGHLVLLKEILEIEREDKVLEVVLHFGTLISILIFFRQDIYGILNGAINKNKDDIKYIMYIVLASIPTAIIGVLLNDKIDNLFNSTDSLLYAYLVTAIILFLTRGINKDGNSISYQMVIWMGIAQVFAILPGISRAGITICAGLLLGFKQKEVAKFSFFLAIPALVGVVYLDINKIFAFGSNQLHILVLGFVFSMITGLAVLKILFKILQKQKLWIFSFYCLLIWLLIYIRYT